jgi:hypothetical protein
LEETKSKGKLLVNQKNGKIKKKQIAIIFSYKNELELTKGIENFKETYNFE